jgi:hypothetical protein
MVQQSFYYPIFFKHQFSRSRVINVHRQRDGRKERFNGCRSEMWTREHYGVFLCGSMSVHLLKFWTSTVIFYEHYAFRDNPTVVMRIFPPQVVTKIWRKCVLVKYSGNSNTKAEEIVQILCFWILSIVLSLSKNTVLFIFQNTSFRRLDSVSFFR